MEGPAGGDFPLPEPTIIDLQRLSETGSGNRSGLFQEV